MQRILLLAVMFLFAVPSAHATIDDDIQRLGISKLQAEASVRAIKIRFRPSQQQYKLAKEKYAAVQSAYNAYSTALLDNYRLGVKATPNRLAELAASREKDFTEYVHGLNIQKGLPAVILTAGVLFDLAVKVYSYIDKYREEERSSYAKVKLQEITWLEWDKVT
jgi:hypothetical protein